MIAFIAALVALMFACCGLVYGIRADRRTKASLAGANAAERAKIEREMRTKVAEEIKAARGPDSRFAEGWASTQDRDHAAAIALGGDR